MASQNGRSKRALQSSPHELSKKDLQMRSPNEVSKLRLGWDLLGACWEFAGCLLGYNLLNRWNTITFQSSYFNELSKWAHQKSSSNELSKLRPSWRPLGVCWESTGSLLIILEFGSLFNYIFLNSYVWWDMKEINEKWTLTYYLVVKIKKSCVS